MFQLMAMDSVENCLGRIIVIGSCRFVTNLTGFFVEGNFSLCPCSIFLFAEIP